MKNKTVGELLTQKEIHKLIETEEGIESLRQIIVPEEREKFETILETMLQLRKEIRELEEKMERAYGLYYTNQKGEA